MSGTSAWMMGFCALSARTCRTRPAKTSAASLRKLFFIFVNSIQCRPIGNLHKTIDFIGDLKSDGCFKWHTPSHGVQKCQKAFIFGVFMRFLWDGCEFNCLFELPPIEVQQRPAATVEFQIQVVDAFRASHAARLRFPFVQGARGLDFESCEQRAGFTVEPQFDLVADRK